LSVGKELAKAKPNLQGEYIITEKIDGIYVYFEYINGTWSKPKSSSGRFIPAFEHIDVDRFALPAKDSVLIAEAYIPGLEFYKTNGLFNRSTGDYLCKDVVFVLHDMVELGSTHTALQRALTLRKFQEAMHSVIAHSFVVADILDIKEYEDGWDDIFDSVTCRGGEGIIAKRVSSVYSYGKRNSDLLKLKLECTVDALAVRLEESIGDKGFPSLTLVSVRSNGTEIRTVIGKHEDQKRFREDPTVVIGKVVELGAMSELPDLQLRQPVFKFIREDKRPSEID
jgi:ATP-dependent DNA ligase